MSGVSYDGYTFSTCSTYTSPSARIADTHSTVTVQLTTTPRPAELSAQKVFTLSNSNYPFLRPLVTSTVITGYSGSLSNVSTSGYSGTSTKVSTSDTKADMSVSMSETMSWTATKTFTRTRKSTSGYTGSSSTQSSYTVTTGMSYTNSSSTSSTYTISTVITVAMYLKLITSKSGSISASTKTASYSEWNSLTKSSKKSATVLTASSCSIGYIAASTITNTAPYTNNTYSAYAYYDGSPELIVVSSGPYFGNLFIKIGNYTTNPFSAGASSRTFSSCTLYHTGTSRFNLRAAIPGTRFLGFYRNTSSTTFLSRTAGAFGAASVTMYSSASVPWCIFGVSASQSATGIGVIKEWFVTSQTAYMTSPSAKVEVSTSSSFYKSTTSTAPGTLVKTSTSQMTRQSNYQTSSTNTNGACTIPNLSSTTALTRASDYGASSSNTASRSTSATKSWNDLNSTYTSASATNQYDVSTISTNLASLWSTIAQFTSTAFADVTAQGAMTTTARHLAGAMSRSYTFDYKTRQSSYQSSETNSNGAYTGIMSSTTALTRASYYETTSSTIGALSSTTSLYTTSGV